MNEELVDVVNELDEKRETMTRTAAHEKVLKHRVVNAWFFNNKGEVLLQQRPRPQSTIPGFLDYTVGGHVSANETYEEALRKETQEETGIVASISDFTPLAMYIPAPNVLVPDVAMHVRKIYAYRFLGKISDLRFDPEELSGFEWRSIAILLQEIQREPKKFVPIFSVEYGLTKETMEKISDLSRDA